MIVVHMCVSLYPIILNFSLTQHHGRRYKQSCPSHFREPNVTNVIMARDGMHNIDSFDCINPDWYTYNCWILIRILCIKYGRGSLPPFCIKTMIPSQNIVSIKRHTIPLIHNRHASVCYSISQEICTRFLLCCALLWLYIGWFSHINQAYFTGTVAI